MLACEYELCLFAIKYTTLLLFQFSPLHMTMMTADKDGEQIETARERRMGGKK
jgi:hypothetical protein